LTFAGFLKFAEEQPELAQLERTAVVEYVGKQGANQRLVIADCLETLAEDFTVTRFMPRTMEN
jgi:hypothetical protein